MTSGRVHPFLLLILLQFYNPVKGTLESPCMYDDSCTVKNSYCERHSVCLCKEGFNPSEDSERCLATVGAYCTSKYDCSSTLEHSDCSGGWCICENNYVPDSSSTSCLPLVHQYKGSCQQSNQCQTFMGDYSECKYGRCECTNTYHFSHTYPSGEKCQRNKGLLERCRRNEECFIGAQWNDTVECLNNICHCKEHYIQTTDNKCVSLGNITTPGNLITLLTLITLLKLYTTNKLI